MTLVYKDYVFRVNEIDGAIHFFLYLTMPTLIFRKDEIAHYLAYQ